MIIFHCRALLACMKNEESNELEGKGRKNEKCLLAFVSAISIWKNGTLFVHFHSRSTHQRYVIPLMEQSS